MHPLVALRSRSVMPSALRWYTARAWRPVPPHSWVANRRGVAPGGC